MTGVSTTLARIIEDALAKLNLPAQQVVGQLAGRQLPPAGAGVPYAGAAHTHPLGDLTQSGAASGQVPQWNGTAWVPATVSGGGGGPPSGAAGGDLGGTYPNPSVVAIQSRAVQNVAPSAGQVLVWSSANSRWEPGARGVVRATRGTSSVGGSTEAMSAWAVYLTRLQAGASDGLIASVSAALAGNSSNVFGFGAACYSDVSGAPGDLLSLLPVTQAFDAYLTTTRRWLTLPLGVPTTAGAYYWVGVFRRDGNAGSPTIAYTATGSDERATSSSAWLTDSPTLAAPNRTYSITATFLEG